MRRPFGLVFACALAWAGQASARILVINANTSDPAPRAAWEAVVADFQRDNPGVTVKFNIYDHESYKKSIRNWLTGASPDVVFWFAGNRMREFVSRKLLTDVSALFGGDAQAALSRAPATGADLLEACRVLKVEGLEPFAIGSKDLWPTAAWFDYLNLRTN